MDFSFLKDTAENEKIGYWGKKPANDVSDKGLLSRTYIKFSGLSNKKTNNPIKKKAQDRTLHQRHTNGK